MDIITGNFFDKYRSPNAVHQMLMRRFVAAGSRLLAGENFDSVLEVGCGPGDLAASLFGPAPDEFTYIGTDICERQVAIAKKRYPKLQFATASAHHLPFADNQFDLCIACEVLEHLHEPEFAVAEIARVTRRFALISVPWEPTWRILNFCRGKYVLNFGNTPGHVQHFSRRAIRRLIGRHFSVKQQVRPLPWTMLLAHVNDLRV